MHVSVSAGAGARLLATARLLGDVRGREMAALAGWQGVGGGRDWLGSERREAQ